MIDNNRKYIKYLQRRKRLDVQIENQTRTDILLEKLTNAVQRKQQIKDHQYNSWIALDTWILINKKAEARRCGRTEYMKQLGKSIRRHLQRDRNTRIGKTAIEIEELLNNNLTREAYARLRYWYKNVSEKPSKPTLQEEKKTREEYEKLYQVSIPTEPNISIMDEAKVNINDDIPNEEEIRKALKKNEIT